MNGSLQLKRYLRARRDGVSREDAASAQGIGSEEARLHDRAEAAGEYAALDVSEPFSTSISVNGGPQVPIDLAKGIDHPDNADARVVMTEVVQHALGHNNPPEDTMTETVAADQLRLFIERIERLEEEKKGMADDIRDVYSEAKSQGYDSKTMRRIVALRKMETHHRNEAQQLLETYANALGMQLAFL